MQKGRRGLSHGKRRGKEPGTHEAFGEGAAAVGQFGPPSIRAAA